MQSLSHAGEKERTEAIRRQLPFSLPSEQIEVLESRVIPSLPIFGIHPRDIREFRHARLDPNPALVDVPPA
jgi:hypothetical protein